jgi:4-amino-4-deoxy-L-arabinose transferase-like glycosyltransferase
MPLLDRDEPRFVRATVEMVEAGEWVVPSFGGQPRFDKPILSYWLMRAGMAVLGQNELGARLYSVASALGLVLATWHTGRRWFGDRVGFVAGFVLATCLQVFIHGRLALADMPLVVCVTVSMVALAELLGLVPASAAGGNGTPSQGWWWALYLSLGFGFLAKGPIVLAVPAVALLLWRLAFRREKLSWSRLKPLPGLVLMIALIAAWGVPALLATDGKFFAVGVGEHVVQRALEGFNQRGYSPFFYLATAPLSLFPWIGFVGLAVVAVRRRWDAVQAWLLAWLTAPYLIFTLCATQLPHYVLPAFPAFSLLLAQGLELRESARWRTLGVGLATGFGAIFLVTATCLALSRIPTGTAPLRGTLVVGLMMLGGFALIPLLIEQRRSWLGLLGLLSVAAGAAGLGRLARGVHPAVRLAIPWRSTSPGTRLIGSQFAEPSLVYYAGRAWQFPGDDQELAALLAVPGPVRVLALARECEPLALLWGHPRWREVPVPAPLAGWKYQESSGFNFGRSRWQVLRIYSRTE